MFYSYLQKFTRVLPLTEINKCWLSVLLLLSSGVFSVDKGGYEHRYYLWYEEE